MNFNCVHKCWIRNDTGEFVDYNKKALNPFTLTGGALTGAEFEAWSSAMRQKDEAVNNHARVRNLLRDLDKKIKNGTKNAKTLERWTKAQDEAKTQEIDLKKLLDDAKDYARGLGWAEH
jgi:hypothetical protein